jgi:hypothetical protein
MSQSAIRLDHDRLYAVATPNRGAQSQVCILRLRDKKLLLVEALNLADSSQRDAVAERLLQKYRREATHLLLQLAAAVAAERAKPKAKEVTDNTSPFPLLEPWEDSVDGAALLDELRALIKNYVLLPDDAPDALALWILHTYSLDAADYTPYILITSPVRECGKTTLLEILQHLAYRTISSAGITAAALYRSIERYTPTMLLDEVDTRLKLDGGEALRGVLNAGFQRSGRVTLCVGDHHEPRYFPVFCPKVLAGIGHVWDTVASRSIAIRMTRASKRELTSLYKIRGHLIAGLCLPYRSKALRWANDNRDALREVDPATPAELGARQSDVWRPLLAIADVVGGDWPQMARAAAVALQNAADEEGDDALLLLSDLRDLFRSDGKDALFTADILDALRVREDRPWPEYRADRPITAKGVAGLIGRFGIKSKTVRRGTDTNKGYALDDLAPVFKRYLPSSELPVTPVTSKRASQAHKYVTDVTGEKDMARPKSRQLDTHVDEVFEILITERDLLQKPLGTY